MTAAKADQIVSEIVHYAPIDLGSGPAWEQLHTLLVSGESVLACALQHRLYALWRRRHLAAATSGRFIYMLRPLLGGYQPISVRWQDLRAVGLDVGMVSASLTIDYSGNLSDTAVGEADTHRLLVRSLEISGAQALYRECQAQEQAWREKRRVRSLEEMRAESGGVQIAAGYYPQPGPAAPSAPAALGPRVQDEPGERLARARDMLGRGLITDAEYEAVKAKILSAL